MVTNTSSSLNKYYLYITLAFVNKSESKLWESAIRPQLVLASQQLVQHPGQPQSAKRHELLDHLFPADTSRILGRVQLDELLRHN
jgi:hypothetical protein